jgi:AcrR family transcriptional regulator
MTRLQMAGENGRGPTQGQVSRDRILRVAMKAFADRGFNAVTIRDLATLADVNLAAINYHFRTKDDLYALVVETALAEWTSEAVVLESVPRDATLEAAVKLMMSALIAPVIERQSHPLLLRLVAWDLLQHPVAGRGTLATACCAVIARYLKPYLPHHVTAARREMIASWLVSQCLLLSPPLSSRDCVPSLDLKACEERAAQIAALALNGLNGLYRSADPLGASGETQA